MKNITIYVTLFLFCGSVFAQTAAQYSPLTGAFSVSGSGTASYSIPIDVVPATLSPKLRLSYNSASADNKAGVVASGWSLSGLPMIHLCSLNKRQDNKVANITVNLSKTDYTRNRFCLSGSRLSVIKGAYGADGSTYQHELLDSSRITSKGTCGNSPCSFTVEKSDGSVSIYGKDATSVARMDSKDIITWAISVETDRFGNKMEYSYLPFTTSNVLYIDKIEYFFNGSKSRKVSFSYTSRQVTKQQNKRIGLGGYSHIPDKLMTKISTYDYDGTGVFDYNLTTTYDPFVEQYYLTSLSKTSADGKVSTFQHSFKYADNDDNDIAFTKVSSLNIGTPDKDWASAKVVIMDKYGDGYNGVGLIRNVNGKAIFTFARGDKDGNLTLAADNMDLGDYTPTDKNEDVYKFLLFDKNADGFVDIVKIMKYSDGNTYAETYLSEPGKPNFTLSSTLQKLSTGYIASGKGRPSYVPRDVNGDGLNDIIAITPSSAADDAKNTLKVFYSDAKGGFPTSASIDQQITGLVDLSASKQTSFLDIDGDYLNDFLLVGNSSTNVLATPLYNRNGKYIAPDGQTDKDLDLGSIGDWDGPVPYNMVDFNGDGLNDFVKFDYTKGQPIRGSIYMNSGNLFGAMANAPNQSDNTTAIFNIDDGENKDSVKTVKFSDITGNGRPDIFKYMAGFDNPDDDTNTYFKYYTHQGNTYTLAGQTQTFGAHTRNYLSAMGDSSLSAIVSVLQSDSEFVISVYKNAVKKHASELVEIDNGIGKKYQITYKKVSPTIDYINEPKPEYPSILLSSIRNVVTSYSKIQDQGKTYGFTRKHDFTYGVPVYNLHDKQFAGYRTVIENIVALDKFTKREYYTDYPLRARLKTITTGKLSTGVPFKKTETAYQSTVKHADTVPKVILVSISGVKETVYEVGVSKTPKEAIVHNSIMTYEPEWGIKISTETWADGSKDHLFKCGRYTNSAATNPMFIVGKTTGRLTTTSKAQCAAFYGKKLITDAYTINDADLKLTYTGYDRLYQRTLGLIYSSKEKAFSSVHSSYDSKGRPLTYTTSKDYTRIDGKFPDAKNTQLSSFVWGDNGYMNKVTLGTLSTGYTIDSRFGVRTEIVSPSGTKEGFTIDSFGTRVATTRNGKPVMSITFGSDSNGDRFERRTTPVSAGAISSTAYITAAQTVWKNTVLTDDDKHLTVRRDEVNKDTGQVVNSYLPYFDIKDAKKSTISYDDRWVKTKVVVGGRASSTTRTFKNGVKTVNNYGNDPSGVSKTPILRDSTDHDYANHTVKHTSADGTTNTNYYDVLGRRFKNVDNRGLESTYSYDMNMDLLSKVTPDAGTQTFSWNSEGSLISNVRGIETLAYEYDINKRMTKRTRTDTSSSDKTPYVTEFLWDEARTGYFNIGALTSTKQGKTVRIDNFDIDGSLVNTTLTVDGKDYTVENEYERRYFPSSKTFPDKSKLLYGYNKSGELTTISYTPPPSISEDLSAVTFSNFDVNRQPSTINYGGKVTRTDVLDAYGRPTESRVLEGSKHLSDTIIEWSDSNNIASKTRDSNKTIYSYDTTNRLVKAANKLWSRDFTYDGNDNLIKLGDDTFTVDTKSNRLTSGKIGGKAVVFEHDSLGRMTADGTSSFAYGGSGRVAKIIKSGADDVDLEYIYHGILSYTKGSDTVRFIDPGLEVDATGTKFTKRVSSAAGPIFNVGPDGKVQYVISDNLGSPIMTIDSTTGLPTSSYEYSPYGSADKVSK